MILVLLDHPHPCDHPDPEPRTRPVVLGQGTRSSLDAALPAVVMLAASGWLGLVLVGRSCGFVWCLIGGKAAQPSRQSSAMTGKSAVTLTALVGSCWPAWLYGSARRLVKAGGRRAAPPGRPAQRSGCRECRDGRCSPYARSVPPAAALIP